MQANDTIQYTNRLLTNKTASTLEHTQTWLKLRHTTLALGRKHQLHQSITSPLHRRYRNHGNTTGAMHAEDDNISTNAIILHNDNTHQQTTLTSDASWHLLHTTTQPPTNHSQLITTATTVV